MLFAITDSPGATVAAGVITAAVAVLGVLATQFATWRREITARLYSRRRDALLDLQDAALVYRDRLREYGIERRQDPGRPDAALPGDVTRLMGATRGRFEVMRTRVDDAATVALGVQWHDEALAHFISAEDVPTRDEEKAWSALNDAVAVAMRSKAGAVRVRPL